MDLFHSLTVKAHEVLKDESTVEIIEKGASKIAYTASGATIFCGLTVSEWGVLIGTGIGVATFIFNIWFKMKYQRGNDHE